ncbi:TRAP transporter permease [Pseudomonas lopnurensis]|uniref:TRAP transporter permease n=1 Tax=Pseudomonas lopnurensis TaxID=1477517 RepID=UPI0028A82B96|nr:TRAP transporter permease [Pseudomonas lopnurensis]
MTRGLVFVFCIALSLFTLVTSSFGAMTPVLQRGIHITLVLVLVLLLHPTRKNNGALRAADYLMIGLIIASGIYLYDAYQSINERIGYVTLWDKVFGSIFILVLLEACRRVVGWALTIIAAVFLAYGVFGYLVPGIFGHRGYSLERIITTMYFTTEGIFGAAAAAAATFVAIFIIFGTFLEKTGGSQVFIDLATALGGRKRGGPAKVAVFASALTGSINGSPVANVTTTGVFTIPLMKRVGYKPHVAGAVEAIASCGGSVLPPVMGVGAFVMSEMAGIPYSEIVVAAIIPALLYFLSIFFVVDFEAAKNNLRGLAKNELPELRATLKKSFVLLIPLAVLIYFMVFAKVSVTRSALYAMLAIVVIGIFNPAGRISFKGLIEILEVSAKRMLLVSVACATAGLVVGIITLSGMGLKLSGILLSLGESSLLLSLLLVMFGTIVVGMGLPPTPAYIVFSVLSVPALLELGVGLLPAHLFVFYFSCFAPITPPVSLAAYTAAGISGSAPMKTGMTAFLFSLPAFAIPFMFIYGPGLLMAGELQEILLHSLTAALGIVAFASVTVGWFLMNLNLVQRMIIAVGAATLIVPGVYSDAIGIAILLLMLVQIQFSRKRNALKAQDACA